MKENVNASYTNAQEKENNGNSGNEELIKTEPVGDTPFVKITVENEVRIALGQFAVTDNLTEQEVKKVEKQIKQIDWHFMIAVLGAIAIQTVEQSYVKVHERMKKEIIKELTNKKD